MNIFPCVTFLEKIYNSILYKLRFKNSTLYKSSLNYSGFGTRYRLNYLTYILYKIFNISVKFAINHVFYR